MGTVQSEPLASLQALVGTEHSPSALLRPTAYPSAQEFPDAVNLSTGALLIIASAMLASHNESRCCRRGKQTFGCLLIYFFNSLNICCILFVLLHCWLCLISIYISYIDTEIKPPPPQ